MISICNLVKPAVQVQRSSTEPLAHRQVPFVCRYPQMSIWRQLCSLLRALGAL